MNARELIAELCRRELCGSPVFLDGGDEWHDSTGWYYSFSGSLTRITDAIRTQGIGYQRAGEAADNVSGPFATEEKAIADLVEFASDESGAEFVAKLLDDDDADRERKLNAADERAARRKVKRKAKKARWLANVAARTAK